MRAAVGPTVQKTLGKLRGSIILLLLSEDMCGRLQEMEKDITIFVPGQNDSPPPPK